MILFDTLVLELVTFQVIFAFFLVNRKYSCLRFDLRGCIHLGQGSHFFGKLDLFYITSLYIEQNTYRFEPKVNLLFFRFHSEYESTLYLVGAGLLFILRNDDRFPYPNVVFLLDFCEGKS